MLNSQSYARDPEILNVGETIASETDFKDPNVKVYYHQTKGACTHMPDGATIQFSGGQFATSNLEIKAYLDKIADKPGTQIYTKKSVAVQNIKELANIAAEASVPTGNAQKAMEEHVEASDELVKITASSMQSATSIPSTAEQAMASAELKKQGVATPQVQTAIRRN